MYRQLAGRRRGWIETGHLPMGERLPATRDLARAFGLSRSTVQHAYLARADLGMLDASVGRGTFVAPSPETRSLDQNLSTGRLTDGVERLGWIVRAARGVRPTTRRRTR